MSHLEEQYSHKHTGINKKLSGTNKLGLNNFAIKYVNLHGIKINNNITT